ncbi:MAG: helix-turn-helix domain-containing protein [Pseudomonadota bacterium]|nr:helix-turn-helix domain-containing protein [Pseudomonadota bacterium]
MNAEPKSLREAHKDLTRDRIVDAAIAALALEPLDNVTVARVARDAGVTERTVYRHFATRDDLLEALWPRINARAAQGMGVPDTPEAVIKQCKVLFPAFEVEEGLTRFVVFTRQGQALRLSINDARQKGYLEAVEKARPDLPPAERRKLAALVQLLSSSFAWASMKDYWGMDGAQSGPAAAEAVRILFEHFARKPKRAVE